MSAVPKEPVGISPRVDCVFRALLADPNHLDRLIDFLNAVLQRKSPIVSLQLRNPIQPSEFIQDGQIVVDVLATDADGQLFQVEMQSWNHAALKERILYSWATLYKGRIEKGDAYTKLRPVVSIWLLDENIFRGTQRFHHRFRVRDDAGMLELSSHLEIHVLELERWRQHPDPSTPIGLLGWMRFFAEAETWLEVPPELKNTLLESAMDVLSDFQLNAARNDLYRSQLDRIRVQKTMESSLEQALAEKEQARVEKEQALAREERARVEKEQALAREERARVEKEQALARENKLRERLRAAGLDPD